MQRNGQHLPESGFSMVELITTLGIAGFMTMIIMQSLTNSEKAMHEINMFSEVVEQETFLGHRFREALNSGVQTFDCKKSFASLRDPHNIGTNPERALKLNQLEGAGGPFLQVGQDYVFTRLSEIALYSSRPSGIGLKTITSLPNATVYEGLLKLKFGNRNLQQANLDDSFISAEFIFNFEISSQGNLLSCGMATNDAIIKRDLCDLVIADYRLQSNGTCTKNNHSLF